MKRYKSDLYFLENYWKDAKEIADNIQSIADGGTTETKLQINYKMTTKNKFSENDFNATIGNTVLAEVVSLSTAQKLKRRGWQIGKTDFRYSKRNNCTVYDLVHKSKYVVMGADAPNDKELRKMCYSVGLIDIEKMPIEHLANRLLEYCKKHKLKLSDYDF